MTGIIILAAGASTRLGSPKQNLIFEGETLLQRVVKTAVATVGKNVIVLLGANADVIKPTISNSLAQVIYNKDWHEGMASSIRLGIDAFKHGEREINSVVLMLCDQPFVGASLLNQLIQAKTKKGIVAAAYNETLGVPVLFDKKYFDELMLLQGQEGAKKLLLKYPEDVMAIPFPLGSVDIDTVEDYERLKLK